MDTHILDSIAKITDQRDIDSLELSLVTTLAELLKTREIILNKLGKDLDVNRLDSAICYTSGKKCSSHIYSSREDVPRLIALNEYAVDCITTHSSREFWDDSGFHVVLTPVIINHDVVAFLSITSECDLTDNIKLIEGMAKVYSNYKCILYESASDTLTGLLNRRTFDSSFQGLIEIQAQRRNSPHTLHEQQKPRLLDHDAHPCLAILDIDHFKNVNDTYGHVIGDEVLLLLSQVMKCNFRSTDMLFRFGGEEFVILLEPLSEDMAYRVLKRFQKVIANFKFPQVRQITISIGFSLVKEGDFPAEVLGRADQSLYYVKEHGRNGVQGYEQLHAKGLLGGASKVGSVELF